MSETLKPIVRLIATGGTIAMTVRPDKPAPDVALAGQELLSAIPDVHDVARVEVEDFGNVPSAYMGPVLWLGLRARVLAALNRPDVAGVVISHGTDTQEETAYFLDLTIQSDKPIVLTGAQRNASERDSDGPRNVLNAVRVAACAAARGYGALQSMNGQIHAARDVTKTHTSSVQAFESGEFGPLGRIDADRVVFHRRPMRRQHLPPRGAEFPKVEIIAVYPGADGGLLRSAVEQGARGVVVAALGAGNVNPAMHEAIALATAAGVAVVISTRVARGRVQPLYGYPGGGSTLKDLGCVFGDDLGPTKARILLMMALDAGLSGQSELQRVFDI